MIKSLVFAALILSAVPLAAFADPMSVGGDGNLFAAASVSSPAASAGGDGAAMSDPADAIDDDTAREPLTTPEPAAPRAPTRQPQGAAHPPGRAPAHAANAAHKKAEATRWQSLLPGVMK